MEKELVRIITLEIEQRRAREITLNIPIRGRSELIMQAWSEKAIKMIQEKQAGKTVSKKPRVPEEEYQDAFNYDKSRQYAMPSTAFKKAMVDACREFDNIPMTRARTLWFVEGEYVPLETYTEPYMRTDMVRLDNGVSMPRYRPGFTEWTAIVPISFCEDRVTPSTLCNVLDEAGRGGIGEWRPSAPKNKAGQFGRFWVDYERIGEVNGA